MRYQATLRPDSRIVSQPASTSGVVAEPLQEPQNEEDRGQKDGGPGSPAISIRKTQSRQVWRSRLLQMANDQRIVAAVGFPRDIKGVAQQRNRPQQHLDADVDHHPEPA